MPDADAPQAVSSAMARVRSTDCAPVARASSETNAFISTSRYVYDPFE